MLILVFLAAVFFKNLFPFTEATIKCGHSPVTANKFAASYTYQLPGEEGYGPGAFKEYYCTEAQAKAAGFHPSPFTKTGQQEYEANQAKIKEERRFDPSKIDYSVYRANISGYTNTDFTMAIFKDNDKQVLNFIEKNSSIIAEVRQGKVGSSYELCTNKKYECKVIDRDSQGRQVKRQYPKVKNNGFSIGIKIGSTFITITRGNSDLTIGQAIQMLGSMQKVTS